LLEILKIQGRGILNDIFYFLSNLVLIFFLCSPEETESYFAASQSLRESLSAPQLVTDGTLKQRVLSLEQAIEIQVRRDDVTYQNILALSKDSERIETTFTQSLNDKTSSLEEALRIFKQEVHHRFDLQNAENKRLQQHITTLKAENHQLQSELVSHTSPSSLLLISFCFPRRRK
jgi:hypothetical protein